MLHHRLRVRRTQWYVKAEPTFSDAIAAVRRLFWQKTIFENGLSSRKVGGNRLKNRPNVLGFNALWATAYFGIICLPWSRVEQRAEETRAPLWRHTAPAFAGINSGGISLETAHL